MTIEPCVCGHKEMTHRYIDLVGENSGECLALKCQCKMYEKEQQ